MFRRVALVRTDVSEKLSASIIRVTRIVELGTTLAVTSNRRTLITANVPSSPILVTLMMEVSKFLRNVGFYKSHTAYHPRRHHSSEFTTFAFPEYITIKWPYIISLRPRLYWCTQVGEFWHLRYVLVPSYSTTRMGRPGTYLGAFSHVTSLWLSSLPNRWPSSEVLLPATWIQLPGLRSSEQSCGM
jgi:hypothetical protein